MSSDPHNILNKEIRAADGGDYGYRVLFFNLKRKEYFAYPIKWSTGEIFDEAGMWIDEFKISYRYDLTSARNFT